jgi:glyceraldehyde-3-phosphate dehydrogenase/erythrose-4-phosphate dehydrogenase
LAVLERQTEKASRVWRLFDEFEIKLSSRASGVPTADSPLGDLNSRMEPELERNESSEAVRSSPVPIDEKAVRMAVEKGQGNWMSGSEA